MLSHWPTVAMYTAIEPFLLIVSLWAMQLISLPDRATCITELMIVCVPHVAGESCLLPSLLQLIAGLHVETTTGTAAAAGQCTHACNTNSTPAHVRKGRGCGIMHHV